MAFCTRVQSSSQFLCLSLSPKHFVTHQLTGRDGKHLTGILQLSGYLDNLVSSVASLTNQKFQDTTENLVSARETRLNKGLTTCIQCSHESPGHTQDHSFTPHHWNMLTKLKSGGCFLADAVRQHSEHSDCSEAVLRGVGYVHKLAYVHVVYRSTVHTQLVVVNRKATGIFSLCTLLNRLTNQRTELTSYHC